MGKGKNKQRSNDEQNLEQSNKNDNGCEEKSTESDNSNNNNNNNNKSNGVIVLRVYLHCEGCAETVVKSLRGFEDIEEVETNMKDHRVTVKAKTADPVRVTERVRKKTGKHVELISPIPKKQPEKKEEKKPEAPKVVETVLKMNLHCEGCARDVKYCLHKMPGVQTVNTDMNASRVVVKGTLEPKDVVEYIKKRMGRHVEMVKLQKEGEKKEDQEKKEKEKDGKNAGSPYANFPPGLVYAPSLFSDENPNACFVM